MRILLLILQFPPDVNSNGRLFGQIAADLAQRGHNVDVITTFPHYANFRVEEMYRRQLFARDRDRGVNILRLWVYASGRKDRMVHRFLSYFSFSVLAAFAGALMRGQYDVVVCPNGGFLPAVAASLLARLKRVPLILNIQDLYPETPIRLGQIREPRVIRILRAAERFMYRSAECISVITPYFRKYLIDAGVSPESVVVIPNFVDTNFIRPLPKDNEFSRKNALSDRFVVAHAGNIGYAYDLATMVDAAAQLRERQDVLFLFVGEGVVKADLEHHVRRLELTNVRFMGYQPLDELPLLRATADVQVALNQPGASAHSLPSKVYEIMASARPVLASADRGSDLWNLIETSGCGLVVEPHDAAALAAAVRRLADDPVACAEMGRRGRDLVEKHFSRGTVAAQYETVLTNVIGAQAPPRGARQRTGAKVDDSRLPGPGRART